MVADKYYVCKMSILKQLAWPFISVAYLVIELC